MCVGLCVLYREEHGAYSAVFKSGYIFLNRASLGGLGSYICNV